MKRKKEKAIEEQRASEENQRRVEAEKRAGTDRIAREHDKATESGEIEMFLINCKDTKNWYVCNGVSARHIKTTRMLGGFQGKFGAIKLPETVMYQKEFEAEYGKVN